MKRLVTLCFITISFFGSANAQKYGLFKPLGKVILFADTLRAQNTADMQIIKLKNDTSAIMNKYINN